MVGNPMANNAYGITHIDKKLARGVAGQVVAKGGFEPTDLWVMNPVL